MIWFILIAIDLMIFLFQRLQKQSLRSLPLIGGNVLILIFLYSPEVSIYMWKSGVSNVGVRIRSLSNLIDADEKKSINFEFQYCFLPVHWLCSDFLAGSTPDGPRKQGLLKILMLLRQSYWNTHDNSIYSCKSRRGFSSKS